MFRALTPRRLVATVLLVAGTTAAVSEAAHWIASKGPTDKNRGKHCAVLVLGSPANADGSATEEERLRVEARIREFQRKWLRSAGAFRRGRTQQIQGSRRDGRTGLKRRHNTSPQNCARDPGHEHLGHIRRSLPLLDRHADTDCLDALHAQRGRRYLSNSGLHYATVRESPVREGHGGEYPLPAWQLPV